jgi:simple sugar transport system substrate-binding protein/ribose transport system substrate-binding protein
VGFTAGLFAAAAGLALSAHAALAQDANPEPVIATVVFQQDQFFRCVQLGMESAAKSAGLDLIEANSEAMPDREAAVIETFIARKVDALVISPASATASMAAIRRAAESGIKVILYNSALDDSSVATASVTSDQRALGAGAGREASAFIRDKLGGKAVVGLLGFQATLPEISGARTEGFLDAAQRGGTVTVAAEQDGRLAEKAIAVAADMLTAHPEINVIFAANEGGTIGAVQAIRRAGLAGKVHVFGIDASRQLAEFLLDPDGVLEAVAAQQPFEIGRLAVERARAAVAGKPVPPSTVVPSIALRRAEPEGIKRYLANLGPQQ